MRRIFVLVGCCGWLLSTALFVEAVEVAPLLETLNAVGPQASGHAKATAAWQQLAKADAKQLPEIIAGLDEANPLAANWIRAAVDTIAQRQLAAGKKLPAKELEKFTLDTEHAPRARRLAFEWLAKADQTAPDRLIPGLLHDPSVEFRRDAVARLLAEGNTLFESDKQAAIPVYQNALSGARDLDQVEATVKRLRELGQAVDLPRHFGYLLTWKLVGPFDNTDKKGFAIAYAPEQEQKDLDFAAVYPGKTGEVRWIDHTSTDENGKIDLNKALGKNMGAVAYAVAFFDSSEDQTVDFRLSSANANKLWVNGELISEHEVYHANVGFDQYIAQGRLKPGRNVLLLKICQNEQTDSWAQDWLFQFRVCDKTGTAILSTDRPAASDSAATAEAGAEQK